jgi:catechol 2,3-dioxygenase-like lactoylglutathione lyase family enzyme
MFARINHMAMISENYALLERYYRAVFGFKVTARGDHDAEASTVVGDGNVGLNILPRRDGYVGGIDHRHRACPDEGQAREGRHREAALDPPLRQFFRP